MEGAGVATVALAKPALWSERRAVEPEAENVGASALLLRLDPGPGRVDDGEVAAEGARRGGVSLRRSARVGRSAPSVRSPKIERTSSE